MRTPAELCRRALEVLVRQLGYAEAMRFMRLFELGQSDYIQEREKLLPSWSPEELLRQADLLRAQRTA